MTTWQELRHATRTYSETEPKPAVGGPQPWRKHARCRDSDTRLFFSEGQEDQAQALQICSHCPVMIDCRKWAITAGEQFGIFGGLTAAQRRPAMTRQPCHCQECGALITAPRRTITCSVECAQEHERRRWGKTSR